MSAIDESRSSQMDNDMESPGSISHPILSRELLGSIKTRPHQLPSPLPLSSHQPALKLRYPQYYSQWHQCYPQPLMSPLLAYRWNHILLTATPRWYELQNHLTLDVKTKLAIIDFGNSVGGAWAKKRIHFRFRVLRPS